MLFEVILMWIAIFSATFLIGIPLFQLIRAVLPKREKNPLVEAKARLNRAILEAEAAKINKQTDELYDGLYKETLAENEATDETTHRRIEK